MIFCLLFVFFTSLIGTYFFMYYASKKKWLDVPNGRSSHTQVTPRGGGIVFIGLWVLILIVGLGFHLVTAVQANIFLPSALLIASVGFWDDRYSIAASWRALAYFLASAYSVYALGGLNQLIITEHFTLTLNWLGSLIAIFSIVWSTNLFNFMDGIDGLAAVEALFLLVIGGFFFWFSSGQNFAFLAWLLAAAVAGFLIWNKPPAKLFMGDVGSATLGFIVMVLALVGEKQYGIPVLVWIILYAAFLFDATVTLIRRFMAKEKWYTAHRSHAYQRLHRIGFSHGQIVSKVVFINIFLSALSMLGFFYRDFIPGLIIVAFVALSFLYVRVERLNPMYSKQSS